MKNNLLISLTLFACMLLAPTFTFGQARASGGTRGEILAKGSTTFKHVTGTYTSKNSSCTISSSPTLLEEKLEFVTYIKTKNSNSWQKAESGTLETSAIDITLCYPEAKMLMVILSCRQKDGGNVRFNKGKCKKG